MLGGILASLDVGIFVGSNSPFALLLATSLWFLKQVHDLREKRVEKATQSQAEYEQDPGVPFDSKIDSHGRYEYGTKEIDRRVIKADYALVSQVALFIVAFVVLILLASSPTSTIYDALVVVLPFTLLMALPTVFILKAATTMRQVQTPPYRV